MRKPIVVLLAATACLASVPATADDVAGFYKGRTITITAASGAGGGYGVYALLLADHIAKYIPGNPSIIVNYNPGGGGVIAANQAFSVAPKDGTALLAPLQSMPTLQVIGKSGVRYDAAKFQWIGRAAGTTSGFIVRSKIAATTDELVARKAETIVGITQVGAPNHILPALLKYCPGANLKLVSGYKGSPPIVLAFKRDEVDGLALPLDSLRIVYRDIMYNTLVAQSGLVRAKDFPGVPLTIELCKDPQKRKVVEFFQTQELMGRSFAAPPGTPAARVEALRKAFDLAIRDPALIATAQQRQLEIDPMSGAEVQKLVADHVGTEGATVEAAKRAVSLEQ